MQGKSTTPRHSQRRHALGIRSAVGYSAGDPHTHMHRLCHSTPYTSTRRIFAVVQRETDTYTRTLKYFSAALLEKQQSDYGTPATQASNNFAENFKPRGADDPAGPRSEKHTPPQPACLYPHSTPLHHPSTGPLPQHQVLTATPRHTFPPPPLRSSKHNGHRHTSRHVRPAPRSSSPPLTPALSLRRKAGGKGYKQQQTERKRRKSNFSF